MGEIINFRDLGGIKTRDGRMVASKRLLRSGELVDLDQKDVEMLRTEYNLKHIFDFRDDGEVELSPDVVMEGVRYSHVDLMKDVELGSTSKRNLFQLYDREEKAVDQMRFIYQAIIRSQTARKGYHDFIQCVSGRKEGAVLFHCFAGKDRTGIAAMLLLKLLGVDDEAVMEDYIITNERRKAANDELLDKVRESGVPEEKVAALRTFIMVREEYLVAAREVMDEEYGSFEGYVEKGLRLDAKCLEQFKENYLE